MKIREGFVSNSSSSSFIIGVKDAKSFSRKALNELFGVVPGTIAEKLVKPYIDTLLTAGEYDIEEVLYDFGYDTVDELIKGERYTPPGIRLAQKGYKVYAVSVSSEDDDSISCMLHNYGLPGGDIKTGDIVLIHEG